MTLKKLTEKLDPSYRIPFAYFCGMIVGLGMGLLASVEKTEAWMYIVFFSFFLAVTALFTFFLYRLYLFLSKRKQKMNSPYLSNRRFIHREAPLNLSCVSAGC